MATPIKLKDAAKYYKRGAASDQGLGLARGEAQLEPQLEGFQKIRTATSSSACLQARGAAKPAPAC